MMLLRALCIVLLVLGSEAAVSAEADATADAAVVSDATDPDTADSDDSDDTSDDEDSETAAVSPLDGEGFVPSVQISEDLSVSFPTDI